MSWAAASQSTPLGLLLLMLALTFGVVLLPHRFHDDAVAMTLDVPKINDGDTAIRVTSSAASRTAWHDQLRQCFDSNAGTRGGDLFSGDGFWLNGSEQHHFTPFDSPCMWAKARYYCDPVPHTDADVTRAAMAANAKFFRWRFDRESERCFDARLKLRPSVLSELARVGGGCRQCGASNDTVATVTLVGNSFLRQLFETFRCAFADQVTDVGVRYNGNKVVRWDGLCHGYTSESALRIYGPDVARHLNATLNDLPCDDHSAFVQFGDALRINFEFHGELHNATFLQHRRVQAHLARSDLLISNFGLSILSKLRHAKQLRKAMRIVLMSPPSTHEQNAPGISSSLSPRCNWNRTSANRRERIRQRKMYLLPLQHLSCGRLDARGHNAVFPDDAHLCVPGPHIDLALIVLSSLVDQCCVASNE